MMRKALLLVPAVVLVLTCTQTVEVTITSPAAGQALYGIDTVLVD